jgi:hypothetical protein
MGNSYLDKEAAEQAQAWAAAHDGWWGDRYATGIDFARQTDFTVITTLDVGQSPARLVYYKRLNRVPWDAIYAEVGRARQLFGPNILCDSTGPGGDVVMDNLGSSLYCPHHRKVIKMGTVCTDESGVPLGCPRSEYLSLSCAEGFAFSAPRKKELIDHLRLVLSLGYDSRRPDVQFGNLRVPPIVQLEEELSFYAWEDKRLQTDCVFSLALSCWAGLEFQVAPLSLGSPFGS